MDILQKGLKYFSILSGLAALVTAWPSAVHHPRFVLFQKKLTIQTSKLDPPRVAFDEIYNPQNKILSDWDLLNKRDGTQLGIQEKIHQFAANTGAQILNSREVTLQPMRFSHFEVTASSHQESQEKDIARGNHEDNQPDNQDWAKQLSSRQQLRLATAQQKYGQLGEDWQEPDSFSDFKEKTLQQAQTQSEYKAERAPAVYVSSTMADGTVVTPATLLQGSGPKEKEKETDTVGKNQSILVSGAIEFSRGAGLPSGAPWQIEVARYQGDIQKEVARIDTKKSVYEIRIPEATGILIAHLVNTQTGQVLGEGTYRLSSYSAAQFAGNAKIVIGKSPDYVASNFATFSALSRSFTPASGKPVATRVLMANLGIEGKTDESGMYRFDQIKKGSWTLLRSEAKNYQAGLHLVRSGSEKTLQLFTQSMVESLKKVMRDQALSSEGPETGSLVWGQVIQSGKPIPGAQVQVENLPNVRPVYFNSMMFPDPSMKTTGENGYFAFVDLPSGFHSLLGLHGNMYLSHANVVVDEDSVSVADLESSFESEKVEVKIFDGFSGAPEKAMIEMQSLPGPLQVNGFADIHMPTIDRMSLIRVHPESKIYLDSLQIYEDSQEAVPLPLIRQSWLNEVMLERKINLKPETGVIVGFSQTTDYEVYLGHQGNDLAEQIVYFDLHGNVISKGEAGGGFIMFNVPQGVQSIIWANQHTNLLQTQVVPMDSSALAILKFR